MTFSGAALQRELTRAYPYLQECIRKRDTGHYVFSFGSTGWTEPIAPADVMAADLIRYLPSAQVVSTYQIKADWRPEQPVINTQVTIRFNAFAVGDTVRLHLKAGDMSKTIQRTSKIHEVKQSTMTGTTYYRVSLMTGMDHCWMSEETLLEVNPRPERPVVVKPVIIPRERALMVIEARAA